jgi:hypothetical protein
MGEIPWSAVVDWVLDILQYDTVGNLIFRRLENPRPTSQTDIRHNIDGSGTSKVWYIQSPKVTSVIESDTGEISELLTPYGSFLIPATYTFVVVSVDSALARPYR